MSDLERNAWRAHFRACSDEPVEFGADFGQLLTSNVFDEEYASTESPDEGAQEVLQQSQTTDKPIELTAGQKVSQSVLQTTGQINKAGTGEGPGIMASPLAAGVRTVEYALIGVGVLAGLYFVSNIASAVKR
jgi:hypothetical protein